MCLETWGKGSFAPSYSGGFCFPRAPFISPFHSHHRPSAPPVPADRWKLLPESAPPVATLVPTKFWRAKNLQQKAHHIIACYFTCNGGSQSSKTWILSLPEISCFCNKNPPPKKNTKFHYGEKNCLTKKKTQCIQATECALHPGHRVFQNTWVEVIQRKLASLKDSGT